MEEEQYNKFKFIILGVIFILFFLFYVFFKNRDFQQLFYSSGFWFNDRMNNCSEDCEIDGRIFLSIVTPAMSSNYQSPDNWVYKFELNRVYLFAETLSDKGKICVDKITLNEKIFFDEDICNKVGDNTIEHSFDDLLVQPSVTNGIIFGDLSEQGKLQNESFNILHYPFTQFNVPARIQFYYYYVTDQDIKAGTIYPGLYIETTDDLIWNITMNEEKDFIVKDYNLDSGEVKEVKEKVTKLQIHASAPLLYKIITIVLFTMLFILICIVITLNKTSDFVQGITAMLFGVFSTKQILVPKRILDTYTIVDFGFLILYVFLLYAILDHSRKLIYKPFSLKNRAEKLVSSKKSRYFHKHNSTHIQNVLKENIIYFANYKEAMKMRKIPCSICLKEIS